MSAHGKARVWQFAWVGLAFCVAGARAQVPGTPAASTAQDEARDEAVDAASALIGRATILRGFYGGAELKYDAQGRVQGQPKPVDWTLAGVSIEKVMRTGAAEIELDGVRVAIRYNPEQHTFDRHPQKEEKVRIFLAMRGDPRSVKGALAAMFSVGIDPALQGSMPPWWKHYFMPALDWGADDLAGQTILPVTGNAPGLVFPALETRVEADLTPEAERDKVKGAVQIKFVVGADGVPRRIAIRQPLGYGLDEQAVRATAKYRFQPGTKDGKPMAMELLVNQQFEVTPGR